MSESWTIGMRSADATDTPDMSWARLLYHRLTGQHYRAVARPKTSDSEARLGWSKPYIYFFLGRCEPEYGDAGIANVRPESLAGEVCPFDTGGMIQGKIPLVPDADNEPQRRALVERWSMSMRDFPDPWTAWGSSAYPSSGHYTAGGRPRHHLVAEVLVDEADNPRTWMWEGRLAGEPAACSSVKPWLLALSRARLDQYRTWLRSRSILDVRSYARHMEMVTSILLDPEGHAEGLALNRRLEGVSQW